MTSNIEGRDVHNTFLGMTSKQHGLMEIFVVKIFGLVYSFGVYPMVAGIRVVQLAAGL